MSWNAHDDTYSMTYRSTYGIIMLRNTKAQSISGATTTTSIISLTRISFGNDQKQLEEYFYQNA